MKHQKALSEYEDRYDRITVQIGREKLAWLLEARDEFKKKVKEEHGKDPKPKATEFWWGRMGFLLVEIPLGERWEERSSTIKKWQLEDEARDGKLENTRPSEEPICYHCGKTGLKLSDKMLHNRTGNYSDPNDEQVLFMFRCTHCQKSTSYWQDGELFKPFPHLCSGCGVPIEGEDARSKELITTTYDCSVCGHVDTVELDLRPNEEKSDPEYERDRLLFCYDDERGKKYLEYRAPWDSLRRDFEKQKEKDKNKDLYDAIEKMEKLKVVELIDKLKPAIEEAGYVEVRFDKPEIGHSFIVGFSCLDGQSAREDYISESTLRKAVKTALNQTNWRLTSDGITYRLGYLSGTVRAYENEDDLLRLVKKSS